MPKIKTSGVKYPDGWELIEPTLSELHSRMREGQFGWPSGITSAVYVL
jgi:bud site selection protein 31